MNIQKKKREKFLNLKVYKKKTKEKIYNYYKYFKKFEQ